ncbi:putative nucleolar GTP-binding protein [Arabidopsis thaliana]
MKSKKIGDHLNRFHVAMPKSRDDQERLPCIPQVAGEKEKRKTEKDLEDENGGAGVYSASLKKNYILAKEEWKDDIIPEICDCHNVADFVDSDILNRLEELTSEESLRKAEEEEVGFEIEGEELTEKEKNDLAAIRKKKALLIEESRLKKSNAQNRAAVPRKFDKDKKFTRKRMGRELSSLGLDPSSALNRARSKSRGRKRERYDDLSNDAMDVDVNDDEQHKKKKMCLRSKSRSLSRSRSVSRPPHEVVPGEGFKDSSQKIKAIKIGHKSHRKRDKAARRGEADRVIPSLKPKHLFSGKRGNGKNQRR